MTHTRGERRRVGLVINPIAGIGGRVGLKGSDGASILARALELGAVPEAGSRARRALDSLRPRTRDLDLLVGPGEMGEEAARATGFEIRVVGSIVAGQTTAADTKSIVREMKDRGAELILFVGGDGTARDVLEAVGSSVPVLGVAAGVKVYSAVFAVNAARAGEVAGDFLLGRTRLLDGEVLDLDEDAYRAGQVSPALHGFLRVPFRRESLQTSKEPSPASERSAAMAIAADVGERMQDGGPFILGPGTTTRAIADHLGLAKTPVGVDIVTRNAVLVSDANESALLPIVRSSRATIVVTPIGGQGFIFGRGNPQISPRVLDHVDRRDIWVVATPHKLAAFRGRPLLVDTGDPRTDAALAGFILVITGYHESTPYRVAA